MSVDGPPASGSLPQIQAPSLVGEVLDGRYRITRKLGEGGMGEVYAAEHIHIEKRFAIKLLRPEIVSNAEAVQRFRQEARSSSSIGHRNIIAIEDFGQLPDGRIYMCMELLNGAALNDLILTPQPVDRLLNIMIQTMHGLAAAHAKGIVHRDMKPENIFVTIGPNHEDIPKLLDFGIAKVAGNDAQNNLTRTGTIFGTPFYMAPEQALGNAVDARTDIYAIGVIMYELFAGTLPFQGESFMGILTQHITTEPEPVAQRAAKAGRQLPFGLADVITRCMQKDPAQRYSTMDELVNALVQIYRSIAGAGMSTYMEAFPVSARMPAPTPPPLTGSVNVAHGHAPTAAPYGSGQQGPSVIVAPTGGHAVSSASGLYDPSASVVHVPKKSKAGLIIAILAVLAVAGGVIAFVAMENKKATDPGTGSQIASNAGSGSAVQGSNAVVATGSDADGSDGSGSATTPAIGSGSEVTGIAGSGDVGSNGAGSDAVPVDAGIVVNVPPVVVDAGVEAPKTVSVLLMTKNGSTFEVFENGAKILVGPEELEIIPGTPRTLVVKARGFKDKTIVVDGKTRKFSFKLDKLPGPVVAQPPKEDCSKAIVNPKSKGCVDQYCAKNSDDPVCDLR